GGEALVAMFSFHLTVQKTIPNLVFTFAWHVEIKQSFHMNYESNSRYSYFYVPSLDAQINIVLLCKQMIDMYAANPLRHVPPPIINNEIKLRAGEGDRFHSSARLVDSRQMSIYIDTELSDAEKEDIYRHGDSRGLLVKVRDRTYATLIDKGIQLKKVLAAETDFYKISGDTYEEAHQRLEYLKDHIENKDGYKIFYVDGNPIRREKDLHILYNLVGYGTPSDVSPESNSGRGPVDFKISRGATDKTLVEFKLASHSNLRRNLKNQTPIYEKAHDTRKSIKAILYFSDAELNKIGRILRDLKMNDDKDVVLIDARRDNKPSASVA
ncbi:MAG TPA: hypothetical protein VE732_06940, partial [Nitrososphaera sp.]|nr:hypothetical protein [Nitrososphaera sp.]